MTKTVAKQFIATVSTLVAFFGLLLLATPFAMGYPKGSGMTTVNAALGGLIVSFAVARALMAYDARSISLINMALGGITIASPWWMGAVQVPSFLTIHLVCGIGVVVLAAINLVVTQRHRPMGHAW